MRSFDASAPIVVVGLMGSGKTSVSRLLADALGRRMRDSDPDMRERYGASAAEMAEKEGPEVLHDREAEHLREALRDEPPSVIAAAASTVERADIRALLEPAVVIWLDAADEVLAERMSSGSHRPHFESDLRAMLAKQRARRGPFFEEIADMTFDVATMRPEQIARQVLNALGYEPA
ncbi:shikimate kinase [Thermocatellispora tengchongensis]|uniref:Shikimate kinase n=1 Tax=Thermocatellispora tengchongensis TaxID=1073253 RepID=A0A840NXW6_9ACTN|nr:shikimate kinase [Thermocatellispora tengchongensis]MBB5132348.1 shikimate kinase [Thermocatellispora tengchongensis]